MITECLKQCLKDINLLHLKVDAISESIDSLVKNASKKEVKSVNLPSETLPILELFPMNLYSTDYSRGVAKKCTKQSERGTLVISRKPIMSVYKTLHCPSLQVAELSKIGGPTVKEVVKRMMYRLFENCLGMEYSWEGKKKKKVFRSLLISKVIMGEYLYLIPQF